MKITVTLKRDDGSTVPDVVFDADHLIDGFTAFDNAMDAIMALPGQSSQPPTAPPAFTQPAVPTGNKPPYSPSNPAHPKGK